MRIKIKPMSFNKAYKGRVYKSKEYAQYTHDLPYLLPKLVVPEGFLKLTVTFGLSKTNSDLDNCLKPFIDLLQDCYGFNDRMIVEIHAKKELVVKNMEFIDFELSPV